MKTIVFILMFAPVFLFAQKPDVACKVLSLNKRKLQSCCLHSKLQCVISADTGFSWEPIQRKDIDFQLKEFNDVVDKIRMKSAGSIILSNFRCANLAMVISDKTTHKNGTSVALYEFIFDNDEMPKRVLELILEKNITTLDWEDGYALVKFHPRSNYLYMILDNSDPDEDEVTKRVFFNIAERLISVIDVVK